MAMIEKQKTELKTMNELANDMYGDDFSELSKDKMEKVRDIYYRQFR